MNPGEVVFGEITLRLLVAVVFDVFVGMERS